MINNIEQQINEQRIKVQKRVWCITISCVIFILIINYIYLIKVVKTLID